MFGHVVTEHLPVRSATGSGSASVSVPGFDLNLPATTPASAFLSVFPTCRFWTAGPNTGPGLDETIVFSPTVKKKG